MSTEWVFTRQNLKKIKPVLLLTGGCGFVGHHFVEGVLKQTNWNIVILDCLTYAGNKNRLTDISIWEKEGYRVKFIWHDLRAPISQTVSKMIGKVDYIWHLASESSVERSLEDAVPFAFSNVVGTTHLLEWIKKENPQAKTIVFSTDEVFGPAPKGVYYKEDDKFRPSNPYCLLPDTKIITKNGPIPIRKFDIKKEKVISKFKEISKRIGEGKASKKFQFDYNGEILKIETDCGEIKVTQKHKFFRITPMEKRLEKPRIYDNKGNPVMYSGYRKIMEVSAKNLKKGDYILSLRYVPFSFKAVKEDKKFVRFLGYFLGDGSFDIKSKYTRLADEKIDFLIYYRDILKDYLGVSPKSPTGQFGTIYKHGTKNCYYLQFASEKLRKEVNLKDLREVVYKVFNLRKESLVEFLAGFFDAEAWFDYRGNLLDRIEIGQSKLWVLEAVQYLLRKIGIISKISRDNKGWKLQITDNLSLQLVVKNIPSLKIKKETIFRKRQHKNWNNYFYWSEVKEIKKEDYKGKVYDLEVPDKSNYVANYFIVHNSASKAGEEMMAYAFARSFKLPIFVVRSMNIFGERQDPEKFIPKTVRAVLKAKEVILHGTPEIGFSSRCWIHAREVCNALLFLTEKGEPEQFYHIVGEERDVYYLAQKISGIIRGTIDIGDLVKFVDFHRVRPGHDFRYALQGEKLKNMGFRYTLDFQTSFQKTIEWMIKPENQKWLNL